MKLEHFFRLVVMSIFQGLVTSGMKNYNNEPMNYDNKLFYCPRIYCKDGFNVSLQINNCNYCSSENGYRIMGVNWQELEFGYPNMNEKDMFKYSELYGSYVYDDEGNSLPFDESNFDITGSIGSIPIDIMQTICEKHGGIDWDVTLSEENAKKFLKI